MEEGRCTPACRTVTRAGNTLTLTLDCDHLPPRILTDEPRGIKIGGDTDGIRFWASFKAQCRTCRGMLGGFWMTAMPPVWPLDPEMLRSHGARLLVADGCVEDAEGWRCAGCLRIPSDRRLVLLEATVPEPMEGWPA